MMGFGPGMMSGGFSIIFWIVIIGAVYYFFREYNKSNHQSRNDYRHDDTSFEDRGSFDEGKEILTVADAHCSEIAVEN